MSALGIYGLKIAAALATPLAISLIVLAMVSVALKRAGRTRLGLLSAVTCFGLTICSIPAVSTLAGLTLEAMYPVRPSSALPNADVAVVLGGATALVQSPRVEVELTAAGNRVVYAARLYRLGKVRKILISGGSLSFGQRKVPEAEGIRALLIEFGVPDRDILIEDKSRTTRENALFTAELWTVHQFRSGLLVTSAVHMPRAMYLFKVAGLSLTPASTDVRATYPLVDSPLDLIPDAKALSNFGDVLHEWQGLLAARFFNLIAAQKR